MIKRMSQAEIAMMTQAPEGERPLTKDRRLLHPSAPRVTNTPVAPMTVEVTTLKVGSGLPLISSEELRIKNGNGRLVEIWRVGEVVQPSIKEEDRGHKFFSVAIEKY